MIDPLLSLAINLDEGKGRYALLLGSGISTASGILTGWQVVTDICRRLQQKASESLQTLDPVAWYQQKYGAEPDYSLLLEQLCGTAAERQVLLRKYFERLPDEESHEKVPSAAHKAIARLVKEGYFRVIITTNFDRLMEQALEEVGVVPQVISTEHDADGMTPLVHTPATLIKINGDYKDTRIRNLSGELTKYEPPIEKLLDEVFDCFGLIVCGWSAQWDIGLRDCLISRNSRRYSTYWLVRSTLTDAAKKIVGQLEAKLVENMDADQFFTALEEKTLGIRDTNPVHPATVNAAVATVKRLLASSDGKIRLTDLVRAEVERALGRMQEEKIRESSHSFEVKVDAYDRALDVVIPMVVNGCHFGSLDHSPIWENAISRLASPLYPTEGITRPPDLLAYPAMIMLYCAGLALVAANEFRVLGRILRKPQVYRRNKMRETVAVEVAQWNEFQRIVHEQNGEFRWAADFLYEKCRRRLSVIIPDERQFESVFMEFEALFSMYYLDVNGPTTEGERDRIWSHGLDDRFIPATVGRIRRVRDAEPFFNQYEGSINDRYPPLDSEIVNGNLDRYRTFCQMLRKGYWQTGA